MLLVLGEKLSLMLSEDSSGSYERTEKPNYSALKIDKAPIF